MLNGLLWSPRLRPRRGRGRGQKAQSAFLRALRTRPTGGRLYARARAWVGSPRRRSPLRFVAALAIARWAPAPQGPSLPPLGLGCARPSAAARRRLGRPTRRPGTLGLRLALAYLAGGQGTGAPSGVTRRLCPTALGALL